MPRKGENIYKRKDGRWEGRYIKEYTIDKKAVYGYVYGKTYNEARRKLKDRQCLEITHPNEIGKNIALYDDVLKLWLASVQINIKKSSYARYYQIVTTHISPTLGKYTVDKIGTPMIEQYIGYLQRNGRLDGKGGLSNKSISDILTIIKSSLAYARDNGFCVLCRLEKVSVKKNQKEMRVLSVSEQKTLKEYLMNDPDLPKLGVLLSLYTGIRLGEVCALRWEHLKLDQGVLEIRQTMQRVKNVAP